jgi:hypothetical protein
VVPPDAHAERAWALAVDNLAVRQTWRAYRLAIRAAQATQRTIEANTLEISMRERFVATEKRHRDGQARSP